MPRYYRYPWAENGNREEVPDTLVTDAVNYEFGYTPAYSLPKDNPDRRNVDREPLNGALYDITSNQKQWQDQTFPEIYSDDGSGSMPPYQSGFIGVYEGVRYECIAPVASTMPPSSEWIIFTGSQLNSEFASKQTRVSSGSGLAGGGDLSADRTLSVDSTVVRTPRSVSAGDGLTGGGDLSSNRTLSLGTPSQSGHDTSNSTTANSHTHNIKLSTFQNTRQGINDGGFVTPETLHGAFGGPAVSQSDRGFQLLPGGILLNWTSTNVVAPGQSQTVSFPEPYKQAVFNIQVSVLRNANAANENNSVSFSFNGLNSVIARNNSDSDRTIYIFAIGV